MKRFPISAALLVLTWVGIILGLMVRKHECPFRGDIKEVKLEYMLHQDKRLDFDQIIDEIPAWDYESPNPPIGARSAIEIVDRFSRTYLPADEGWKIESISPCTVDIRNSKWCWSIKYHSNSNTRDATIIVLPNGQVYCSPR